MESQNATRIKLLKIWEILCRETDEEHPMDSVTLMQKLADMGIPCNRKTLYADIQLLCDNGYEVMTQRRKANEYYVMDRSFDVPEIHILMDAVQAAGFITEKKTAELVDKIASLAGSQRAEVLVNNIVEFTAPKCSNEKIYYSVNAIAQAIAKKKKIYFNYFDYDVRYQRVYRMKKTEPEKKRGYKVNPLGTVLDNGCYYLFCYDDFFGTISHYRIDRMDNVKMLEEDMTKDATTESFDLSARKRQLFSMFSGKKERVEIHADQSLIDVIYDKFGGTMYLMNRNNGLVGFEADVQVSPTFFAWCCAFGDKLKIVSPAHVVEELKEYIASISSQYE